MSLRNKTLDIEINCDMILAQNKYTAVYRCGAFFAGEERN